MIDEVRDLLKRIDIIVDSETMRFKDLIYDLKQRIRELERGQDKTSIYDEMANLTEQLEVLISERNDLKSQIKKFVTLNKKYKDLETQLDDSISKRDKLQYRIDDLIPLKEKCSKQEMQLSELIQKQEGYVFTIKVISQWIPSQKENIDVLVALSSSPNHELTFSVLKNETTIPKVTLKNRIVPILVDKKLVEVKGSRVKLSITDSG